MYREEKYSIYRKSNRIPRPKIEMILNSIRERIVIYLEFHIEVRYNSNYFK